ncbi:MAG: LytTR family DNA-binding domain-containing protein [Monoglobales bacterium]
MLKIAVCDDNLHELSNISSMLKEYSTEKTFILKIDVFSTADSLLEAMKRNLYNVILLDIVMPGISGIQVAYEIRRFDSTVKIIFLSSSPEFAVESYEVDAHYYLLKPASKEKLFKILDKIFLEITQKDDSLSIMLPSGLVRVPLRRLEYLEVYGKKLLFHFEDGSIKEIRGSISEFEPKLVCRPEFVKVLRSYIVNMEHIESLEAKQIKTYAGHTVPVSRLLYNQVKDAYMQFLFLEKGVE